jgi:hypothetical protein
MKAPFATLILAALTCGSAQAAIHELGEEGLRQVHGGDAIKTAVSTGGTSVVTGFLGLFNASDLTRSVLTKAQFEQTLAKLGVGALPASVYDGRPVAQVELAATNINAVLNLADLFSSVGLNYNSGGTSMGVISTVGLNMGGTKLWVWTR